MSRPSQRTRTEENYDLNTAVETLVGEWGEASYPFEHEICLYRFQVWVYCSRPRIVSAAAVLAASLFLERLGKKYSDNRGTLNSARLVKCFADEDYSSVYNNIISTEGGWTSLLRIPRIYAFDKMIDARRQRSDVVCDIMDYRFRYLDHGGERKQDANITHGQFYCLKKRADKMARTIRKRWSDYKESAVFLYVSERLDPFMRPTRVAGNDFIQLIMEQAKNKDRIRRYFGICRYISEKLKETDANEPTVDIPDSVELIRPETRALSDGDRKLMANYSSEVHVLRA